ncbi:MAG: hypothetical protein ABI112_13025 [Terracoccus sp.]
MLATPAGSNITSFPAEPQHEWAAGGELVVPTAVTVEGATFGVELEAVGLGHDLQVGIGEVDAGEEPVGADAVLRNHAQAAHPNRARAQHRLEGVRRAAISQPCDPHQPSTTVRARVVTPSTTWAAPRLRQWTVASLAPVGSRRWRAIVTSGRRGVGFTFQPHRRAAERCETTRAGSPTGGP